MVILSEFCMGQLGDADHREGAPLFKMEFLMGQHRDRDNRGEAPHFTFLLDDKMKF